MRLRYIIVLGVAGLSGAWLLMNPIAAYITVSACCILIGLRSLEYQIGDLKGRLQPQATYRMPTDQELIFAWACGKSPEKLLQKMPEILRS